MARDRSKRVKKAGRCLFLIVVAVIAGLATAQASLLILAPDEFLDELQPLVKFKNASGRSAFLVGLTYIRNNFTGADDAEKVKRCIAYYESTHLAQYVILAGDVDVFPARFHWWGLPGQENWAFADLYKSDSSFDTWDSDSDGFFGEVCWQPDGCINDDEIDFRPDVAVGRIPASSEEEITRYVNKVISYETETTPDATWFKSAGLYTGDWATKGFQDAVKDDCGASLAARGFTLTKRYWDGTPGGGYPSFNDIINDINSGLGFVNYLGHGNSYCWANVMCDGDIINTQPPSYNRLTNAGKLPIIFACACDTGGLAHLLPFGPYVDVSGTEHCGTSNGETLNQPYPRPALIQTDGDDGGINCDNGFQQFDPGCFAEKWLFRYGDPMGSGGAIAYVGSRSGSRLPWASDMDKLFIKAYGTAGQEILGNMWRYMVDEYYTQHNLGQAHTWCLSTDYWDKGHEFCEPMKYVLFGDPSLIVGGAFRTALCGVAYDGLNGPLASYQRYRVTCNVTVPTGCKLTVQPGASVLLQAQTKMTAQDAGASMGLEITGTAQAPTHLLTVPPYPQSQAPVRGLRVYGQVKTRNGGTIRAD